MTDAAAEGAPGGTASATGGEALAGRTLALARATWIVVALLVVALNVLAIPGLYAAQVDPATLRDLRSLGMSPALFAAIGIAEMAVSQVVNLALALLLFVRRSHDRMALFAAYAFVMFGGIAGSSLNDITGGPSPLPHNPAILALARVLVVMGQVAFIGFWYLFPSGRFVPRWAPWLFAPALAFWIAAAIHPDIMSTPVGGMVVVLLATGLIAQVYRYRAVSTPIEREQTKWVVVGLTAALVLVALPELALPLLPPAVQQAGQEHPALTTLTFGQTWIIALVLIPTCIALAILRYRLFSIDVIIRRTLIYGVLTAILAGVYFAVVLGAQVIGERLTGQTQPPAWVIVVTTLVIAALFTPVRRRVQRVIDRRFYRSRYDAARTIAGFAATLRTELDLGDLSTHLTEVVDRTMRPAHVSLWLARSRQVSR